MILIAGLAFALCIALVPRIGYAQTVSRGCHISATPASITDGDHTQLQWSGPTGLGFLLSPTGTITPALGSVETSGTRDIAPHQTTTYVFRGRLLVFGVIPGSPYTCQTKVTVTPATSCTPSYSCSGNSLLNSCNGQLTACAGGATCSNGQCVGGQCLLPTNCTPAYSCSGNGVLNSCTNAIAQCTGGSVCLVNQCVCPTGDHWDTASNQCVANAPCPIGFVIQGGQCVFSGSCPAGYTVQHDQCVPVTCAAGQVFQGGICVPACVNGQHWDNAQNACVADNCSAGYHWSGTQCVADICIPTNICSGNSVVDSCTGDIISACTGLNICAGGACIVPAPDVLSWQVAPILVRKNNTTNVTWNVEHVASCTVIGTNGDSWTGLTSTKVSSALPAQTIFTLNCKALVGSGAPDVTRSTTVNVVPTFMEK